MRESDGEEIFELGGLVKQGYSAVIANSGKAIALITLTVAALLTFADVAICDIGGQQFTLSLAIMLICSYLMYFSLEDSGEREGEKTAEYTAALERYERVKCKITPDMIDSLRDFCLDYSRNEQEYRRNSYLAENGFSLSDYQRFLSGEKIGRRARSVMHRARRIKAVKLTPTMLLSGRISARKSELIGPGRDKLLSSLTSLLPTTVCTFFTVSVILTAKDGLTASTVMEGILKLCALPVVGFRGSVDGYNFAKESRACWIETKARLLERFLATDEK